MAKKKKKGNAAPAEDISKDELILKRARIMEQLSIEQGHRNYFQLERDKLQSFWEITKNERDAGQSELRICDREMEEMEERHQIEIKVYKQRVKHLIYEHCNEVQLMKDNEAANLDSLADLRLQKAADLRTAKRDVKQDLQDAEYARAEKVRSVTAEYRNELKKAKVTFEGDLREMQAKYEKKMEVLRADLDMRRKVEIVEIEERKNKHIEELMTRHNVAFAEIRNYYTDITHSNLDLIRSLNEEVERMKIKELADEKLLRGIGQENKRLKEPLTRALKEVEQLRHELANYDKDKNSLQYTKARLLVLEDMIKAEDEANSKLAGDFRRVEGERDDLQERFESAISDLARRNGVKTMLLEKKVETMKDTMTRKDTVVGEVMKASNLDRTALDSVTQKVTSVLSQKQTQIGGLEYQIAQMTKQYNDVLRALSSKLVDRGVAVEELGFTPIDATSSLLPAGLVSDPTPIH